jgi:hypothetical protein
MTGKFCHIAPAANEASTLETFTNHREENFEEGFSKQAFSEWVSNFEEPSTKFLIVKHREELVKDFETISSFTESTY